MILSTAIHIRLVLAFYLLLLGDCPVVCDDFRVAACGDDRQGMVSAASCRCWCIVRLPCTVVGRMLSPACACCLIRCSMVVRCVVPGKLLEVNPRLLDRPQLLLDR